MHRSRSVVVEEIETALPHCHRAWMSEELSQPAPMLRSPRRCVVRMYAESAPDALFGFAERQQIVRLVEAHGRHEETTYRARPRSLEHRAALVASVVL